LDAKNRLINTDTQGWNPNLTLPQLSRLTGSSESCVCTRLGKLAENGFACSPKCNARVRWELSQAGREIAAVPLLDDRDRDILLAIARRFAGGAEPAGIVAIAREVGVCNLTVRRLQPRRQELYLWLARPGIARYSVGVSCSVARQFRLELEDSSCLL
jgi:hypothetical protein